MNREAMMRGCPGEFEDRLKEIIDYMESELNDAIHELEEIAGCQDLDRVRACYRKLDSLSKKLY